MNTEEIFDSKFENFYSKKNLNKILLENIDFTDDRIYSAPISKRNSQKNKILSNLKKNDDKFGKEDNYTIVYDFDKRDIQFEKTNKKEIQNQTNLKKVMFFENQNNSEKRQNFQNFNNSKKKLKNTQGSKKNIFSQINNSSKMFNNLLLKESSNFSSETFEKLLIPISKQADLQKSKNITFFSESEKLVSKKNSKLINNYKKNDNLSKITEKINLLKKSNKSIDSIFVFKNEGFQTNLANQVFQSGKSYEKNRLVKKNTLVVTLGNFEDTKKFRRTDPLNITGFL